MIYDSSAAEIEQTSGFDEERKADACVLGRRWRYTAVGARAERWTRPGRIETYAVVTDG